MIYLDNAATTGTKPAQVISAVENALKKYSANPGRSGHKASINTGMMIYSAREKAARFFGGNAQNVVFTSNCTEGINFVIKGILNSGDHVIVSSLEHNAVMRPVYKLATDGVIEYDVAQVIHGDADSIVHSFEHLIKSNTKLFVCTHASNVTGEVMPIRKIGKMCREHGILFLVDAAQTAGIIGINMETDYIDYLCVASHKGLYAPMGTGIMIAEKPIEKTIIEGGTGSLSLELNQPVEMPDRFESGTLNVPGIAGISAGIDFVNSVGLSKIYKHEIDLLARLYDGLRTIPGVRLYTDMPVVGTYAPVLSFNIDGSPSMKTAAYLADNGIAVRAGLHCAPSAHKSIGTIDSGTVRICPSVFNNANEINLVLLKLKMYKKASIF